MNTESNPASFQSFLRQALDRGGFPAKELVAAVLPLFEAVVNAHEGGLISGLRGTTGLDVDEHGVLTIDRGSFRNPDLNLIRIEALAARFGGGDAVGELNRTFQIAEGMSSTANLDMAAPVMAISRPIFIVGYGSWEQVVSHHDPVTDIFLLGQLLASLATGLDFHERKDLEAFVKNRDNLVQLNQGLHPVIAKVIRQMTELDRHKRAQDLAQLVGILKNHRDHPVEADLSRIDGYDASGHSTRRRLIQAQLRERIIDVSRRNPLLHYKPSERMLNLSLASVPLATEPNQIKLEQLFVWHLPVAYTVKKGEAFASDKYFRYEETPYLSASLDRLIAEARHDRNEFGFAQLRLVPCFLHWHNPKDETKERITSPLLFLPVELTKRKGVRDGYVLKPKSAVAEVNPALRHHFRSLFGIALPETVDLEQTSLDELCCEFQRQIRRAEPTVMLSKLDRPEFEVIHEHARQQLELWQQKQKQRSRRKAAARVDYSYDRQNYRPLGLQLFLHKVQPHPRPLDQVNGSPAQPRVPGMVAEIESNAPADEKVETPPENPAETPSPPHDEGGKQDRWTFDLCNLTLGNFHYRRLSLVSDYAELTEADRPNPAFDAVFSPDARLSTDAAPALPLTDQFPIVPCDAAQAATIARARTGSSFVIQGPPGTGKSQTITNLIADYVARGKRVLFVSQKRAALDAVFHRLRQHGLSELCSLIHDSQSDQRDFLSDLKQTYERWLNEEVDDGAEKTRERARAAMMHDLAALERFSNGMQAIPENTGIGLRGLLLRLVEIGEKVPALAPEVEERLPGYTAWLNHGKIVERLEQTMKRLGAGTCFARHPLRWLNRNAVQHPRPAEFVSRALDQVEDLLDSLENALDLTGLPEELWETLPEIASILAYCGKVAPLASRRQLGLLDPSSTLAKTFVSLTADIAASETALTVARGKTANWKDRLDDVDTVNALEAAQRFEHSRWRFLQPAYWRLKKTVEQRYDFGRHAVDTSLVAVLQNLLVEQGAAHRLTEARAHFEREFGGVPQPELEALLREARGQLNESEGPVAVFRRVLMERSETADELVTQLAALQPKVAQLEALVQSVLEAEQNLDFASLRQIVEEVRSELRLLPELVPVLSELADAPEELRTALRTTEVELADFETVLARKSLATAYRQESSILRFDGRLFDAYLERLERHHREWLKSNACTVRARVRRQFRQNIQLSTQTAGQLTEEQKVFKKEYSSARQELQRELAKADDFLSIRELVASPAGRLLRELKPIWLMNPLSVSETLPLASTAFDVVIFDEASRLPIEEAVPALYRSQQVIVVGDSKQLPPTSVLTCGDEADEAGPGTVMGDRFKIDLESNSFLAQSARSLPAISLTWHYRGRYETLVSFSNAAFYNGNLQTIPNRELPLGERREWDMQADGTAQPDTEALLTRSISFHFSERGVYEQGKNATEANTIAVLVRDLLQRDTKSTVGIVAFSEAQQAEIEQALAALAEDDPDFSARLDAERVREKDDQFCGLFVKNLEEVQGDERDIILLSVGYGYDRERRMRMNFGAINQCGGEKRLNVVLSRAKLHLAVISSIRHVDITNEYNDGARALKTFLNYTEALAKGDHVGARAVLENFNPLALANMAPAVSRDTVIEQVAEKLRQRGHQVDLQVGQSRFRCDVAVRRKGEAHYTLAVLVDTDSHYRNSNLVDRYLTQPGILRAFGWKVAFVLTKDWLHEPEAVIERLERELRGALVPRAELPEIPGLAESSPERTTTQSSRATPTPSTDSSRTVSAQPAASRGTTQRRYLEIVRGPLKKFWEVSVEGPSFTVRFGRIGTAGETQQKVCSSNAEAKTIADDLARAKLSKGYREVSR